MLNAKKYGMFGLIAMLGVTSACSHREEQNVENLIANHKDDYAFVKEQLSTQSSIQTSTLPLVLNERKSVNTFFDQKNKLLKDIFTEVKQRIPNKYVTTTFSKDGLGIKETLLPGAEHKQISITFDSGERLVFDGNKRAAQFDYYNPLAYEISRDGKYVAVIEDYTGDEVGELVVFDSQTHNIVHSGAANLSGSVAWHPDSDHVFVIFRNENERPFKVQKVNIHSGSAETVYEDTDPEKIVLMWESSLSDGLIIASLTWETEAYSYYSFDQSMVTQSIPAEGSRKLMFDVVGETTYAVINNKDGGYIINSVTFDGSQPIFFPEFKISGNMVVEETLFFKDYIVLHERHYNTDKIRVIETATKTSHYIDLPEDAFGVSFGNLKQALSNDLLRFRYTSFKSPYRLFTYDLENRRISEENPYTSNKFNPDNYNVIRSSVPTDDGVNVPVTIIQHKNLTYTKDSPVYLYTYGSYGEGVPPEFPTFALSAIDRGFTYAIAHVRGGNELGKAWHEGGRLFNRHNSINDFLAVANWLVENNYTSAGLVSASGESGAGQIIGMAVNKQPELFNRVAMLVPFVDVLGVLLDETLIYTVSDWNEFGNPSEDVKTFNYIKSLSPTDTITKQNYPSTFVTAAFDDPAVGVWEPVKWTLKLRDNTTSDSIHLVEIRDGGHMATEPYSNELNFSKVITFIVSGSGDYNE